MRKKFASLVRLVSCGLTVASLAMSPFNSFIAHAAIPASPIVIGEVAWAGSSLSDADEWVELWNLSEIDIQLTGWSLRGAGENGKTIYLPSGSVIPGYGTFLIANYDSANVKSALEAIPQTVTTTVSLSNSALKIELYDDFGNQVDVAGTGSAPPFGLSQATKTSMLRQNPMLDGTADSAWTSMTERQNMKSAINDLATPGFCDRCKDIIMALEPDPTDDSDASAAPTSTDPVTTPDSTTTTTELLIETTTEQEISPDTSPSSTSSSAIDDPGDSTTSSLAIIEQQTASTSDSALNQVQSPDSNFQAATPSAASSIAPSQPATPPKPNFAMLRLNEIMPYPASGKEWVEVVTLDATNSISLNGCELHDGQGRILTLGSRTIDPAISRYLKIEISSARLNNTGDSVSLYSPTGLLLDTISFPSLKKDQAWIRYPDMSSVWQKTEIITPASANVLNQPAVSVSVPTMETAAPASVLSASTSSNAQSNEPIALANVSSSDETNSDWINGLKSEDDAGLSIAELIADLSSGTVTSTETESAPITVKAAAKKLTTKKSSSSTSKVEPIIPFTFAMLNQIEDSPLRVRLAGAVGSTSGLLPNHSFVLQSPEGRGLLVKVPTNRRLPAFGDDVSVVGKLYIDDRGTPYLKMATKDPLETQGSSTASVPRLVDLTAPSNEDAWALMSVTGTVKSVKGRTVLLDLGDVELNVSIRQSVKYRPQRLLSGDIVRISGLLDTTRDQAVILPRIPEDIVLIEHAKIISTTKPAAGMDVPGWTPIGAAAGAIAVTEGAKHLNRRRKQKLLENKLKQLITTEVL